MQFFADFLMKRTSGFGRPKTASCLIPTVLKWLGKLGRFKTVKYLFGRKYLHASFSEDI